MIRPRRAGVDAVVTVSVALLALAVLGSIAATGAVAVDGSVDRLSDSPAGDDDLAAVTAGEEFPGAEKLNVTATVAEPDPDVDSPFDVTVRIENSADQRLGDMLLITEATLADETGDTASVSKETSKQLTPGGTQQITFENVEIDDPGITTFRATLDVTTPNSVNTYTVQQQVDVAVSLPAPVVDLEVEPAPSGADRTLSVAVGNPLEEPIKRIEAAVEPAIDAPFRVVDGDGTIPALDPGETRELTFDVRDAPAGTHELDVSLSYEGPRGEFWEITEAATTEFVEPSNPTTVDVADVSVGSSPGGVRISGTLVAAGETPVEHVEITPADAPGVEPASPDPQAFVRSLNGTKAPTFELTAALSANRSTIPLRLEYRAGGTERTTTTEIPFAEPSNAASVDVTDISVRSSPTGVRISGAVVAGGETPVENVEITAVDAPGTGPARPDPQAFVKSLNGTTAPTFELTAALSANRSTVPLRIEYSAGGTGRATTTEIQYSGPRNVAPVQLTDLTTVGGETVTISGSVANTWGTDVTGVSVAVADADGVVPGRSPEFFVGPVESGSFGIFEELTAQVQGDRETVPVEISYVLDGNQYSTVTEVEHDSLTSGGGVGGGGSSGPDGSSGPAFDPGTDDGDGSGGGLPGPELLVAGGVAVLAILGVVVHRRR